MRIMRRRSAGRVRDNRTQRQDHSPLVQLLAPITPGGDQHSDEMREGAFPNTEFKLVHEVGHEKLVNVATEGRKLL